MTDYIAKDAWNPVDQMNLEPSALLTVKSEKNVLVTAGPGAGKTELLAQRACYLLQTNECSWPKKILAISFKRDAAANIKERVKKRCGESLAERFDSHTFDSFAFFILNHFYRCLPDDYKINPPIQIIWKENDIYQAHGREIVVKYNQQEVLDQYYRSLPFSQKKASFQVWHSFLSAKPSRCSFKMIMRLAQFIVATNPLVKKILQQTYSHIFLDEFQDTTTMQFDFLSTCFGVENHIFTAVGDDKQKIMGWAGANKEIFENFKTIYSADDYLLTVNHRSAANLVHLQNLLIKELLKKDSLMTPDPYNKETGEAYLFLYNNPDDESTHVIKFIKERMVSRNLKPRDFCIIVKQQINVYAENFLNNSGICGLTIRNDDAYSYWLEDELFSFILDCLFVIFGKGTIESWDNIQNVILNLLYTADEEKNYSRQRDFEAKLYALKKETKLDKIIDDIISFLKKDKISSTYPDYQDPHRFDDCKQKLLDWITERLNSGLDLTAALSDIRGDNSIPIMTIHKSKGLEYDTVIFIGLEDYPFRHIGTENSEDENAFFVALSRAKNAVAFTFAKQRKDTRGITREQTINSIDRIYNILYDSKLVHFEQIET